MAGWPRCARSWRWPSRSVGARPVDTVFVGGGTPSLLGGSGLAAVLDAVRDNFALTPDAEVTTEANPESTSRSSSTIGAAGYTRVSLGMQSAAPGCWPAGPDPFPGRALQAARGGAGRRVRHVNLDLIYGAGEATRDLRQSVGGRPVGGVDHVSAYALVVGTAPRWPAASTVARSRPDDDDAGTPLRTAGRLAVGGRSALVRGVELESPRRRSAGTTSATGTAGNGGVPGRRAQLRR